MAGTSEASVADGSPLAVATDRTFVRCLFPFSLTGEAAGFDALVGSMDQSESMNPNEGWKPTSFGSPPYLLPHVVDFVAHTDAPGRAYAKGWRLGNDTLQRRFKTSCVFESTRRGESWRYPTRVSGVTLYAFRSGVGVLVLELEPQGESSGDEAEAGTLTLDGLTRFVRAVRAIRAGGGRHRFMFRESRDASDEPQYRRETVAEVVEGLLQETVGEESTGDEGRGAWTAFYEHRLLTYTYALVVSDGEALTYDAVAEPLYRLRHAFDLQYSPSAADLDGRSSPEVLQTFGNVCLGLSMEGGAMLSLDNGTPFVRDGLAARAGGAYFLLFLLALHQRLGALHMAQRMSEVARRGTIDDYDSETTRAVTALRNDFFEFKLRSWFADVSNLTMYTRVYRRWQEVLGVDPVLTEVMSESRELDDYLRRARDERLRERERKDDLERQAAAEAREQADALEARRERERADHERAQSRLLNVLTLFFLPLTVVGGLLGMNLRGMTEGAPWVWFAASMAAVYVAVVALIGGPRETLRVLAEMRRPPRELPPSREAGLEREEALGAERG